MKETWMCWQSNGREDIDYFRGTKTGAEKFWKANKHKIENLHYGKLILEKVNGKWIDR